MEIGIAHPVGYHEVFIPWLHKPGSPDGGGARQKLRLQSVAHKSILSRYWTARNGERSRDSDEGC